MGVTIGSWTPCKELLNVVIQLSFSSQWVPKNEQIEEEEEEEEWAPPNLRFAP